ncbi:NAD(P)H-dependent oxidoreductase [Anoxynatronum sibiricum]|uniref:NAD(P)H-dependent oxidoreductase n=1 Tax=Anoxynatronum sibiricum TaxID=210623 RepID=A0ABU9VYY8_9CLOT
MSTVILSGLPESQQTLEAMITQMVTESQTVLQPASKSAVIRVTCLPLRTLHLEPCACCEACAYKSPGACALKDDTATLMKHIAPADTLVLLTPVRFGSYSARMKQTVDKFMLLAQPGYGHYRGSLVHPARYGTKKIIGLGVAESVSPQATANFTRLVAHNAHNLQSPWNAGVINPRQSPEELHREVTRLINEASVTSPAEDIFSEPVRSLGDPVIAPLMKSQRWLFLNGSPRREGTSQSFINTMAQLVEEAGHETTLLQIQPFAREKTPFSAMEEELAACDVLVLSAPLYSDTLPYTNQWLLEKLADSCSQHLEGKCFFTVAQCGFPDGSRLVPMLNTCRIFAEETRMIWLGGLAFGGGPLINGAGLETLGKKGRQYMRGFHLAVTAVLARQPIPAESQQLLTVRIPKAMHRPMIWYLNHRVKKEARYQGAVDVNARPYLTD